MKIIINMLFFIFLFISCYQNIVMANGINLT